MHCPYKNSYLQLVCAMNPRVINKAVDFALEKSHSRCQIDPCSECKEVCAKKALAACEKPDQPASQILVSMQPSLYAPHVDISRARMGYGRVGLRLINRDLHSPDHLIQLQALHSVLDQVQISENALFLIQIHVVYRLIDLMKHRNPVVREKVCIILNHLASYHQGRKQIMSRPVIIENLMYLIMRDRKEIRFVAATCLQTLSKDRCACEIIVKTKDIIENILKMIKHDHAGIVYLHLKSFENFAEWDPEPPLKANAFQVLLTLFDDADPSVASQAMECMAQLCKHEVGRELADINDITFILRKHVMSPYSEVVTSAVGLMAYTTLTTRSKWRAKEACNELTKRLVALCNTQTRPLVQLRSFQVLINLCDCPDIRNHMKDHWEKNIIDVKIRTHEEWAGTTETTTYGLETGHYYRTQCIEPIETIRNDTGENPNVVNVHSYLRTIRELKERLIKAMNWKSYNNEP